jgi:hypothetical protein
MPDPIASPIPLLRDLARALGLERIRSIEIRVAIGEAPTVTATGHVTGVAAGRLVPVLRRYRLREAEPDEPAPDPIDVEGIGWEVFEPAPNVVRSGVDRDGPFLVVRLFDPDAPAPATIEAEGLAWAPSPGDWPRIEIGDRYPPAVRPCRDVTYRPADPT